MKYEKSVTLKNGKTCIIRSATGTDAAQVYDNFNQTHGETDYLLTYPDENSMNIEQERQFLMQKDESSDEIEICAVIDGRIAGTAGIESVGRKDKVKHRAEFGISIEKEFWGLGIGRALTEACLECAKSSGYRQIELEAVAENSRAIGRSLY